MARRITTGISGVDEMIEGGLPAGSVTIVSGPPGVGKSTFAMQYLINGIEEHGENGV